MLHEINLKELADIDSPERAVVSLYASEESDLTGLANRADTIRTLLEDSPDELEHFEHSYEMLKEKLAEVDIKQNGICIFSCFALDLCRVYQLSAKVPFLLRIDASPYIRPLARLQDEYEEFLLVAADNSSTSIYLVAAESVKLEETLKGDIKNHVKKGGMSQQRYSRRRDKQIEAYCSEIAEQLEDICREESIDRIVLLGSEETLTALKNALSSQLEDKVVGSDGADLHDKVPKLVSDAYEIFFDAEEQEEKDLWKKIRNAYKSSDLAVLGPEDTLQAVTTGRGDTILINTGVKQEGIRCSSCENVSAGSGETCQFCHSEEVYPIDVIEEIVKHAELTGAHLEFADPALPTLDKLGGVATLLRY